MATFAMTIVAIMAAGPVGHDAPLSVMEPPSLHLEEDALTVREEEDSGHLNLIKVRARLFLANETAPGDRVAFILGCEPPPRGLSVLGFAVGSVNEEYVQLADSAGCHCRFGRCDVGRLALDRPLRLTHAATEEISVLPDSLQVPSGRLTADEPTRNAHHTRAMAAAMKAHVWVTELATVVSQGPDKWALRQLLAVLAITLRTPNAAALPPATPAPCIMCPDCIQPVICVPTNPGPAPVP